MFFKRDDNFISSSSWALLEKKRNVKKDNKIHKKTQNHENFFMIFWFIL